MKQLIEKVGILDLQLKESINKKVMIFINK